MLALLNLNSTIVQIRSLYFQLDELREDILSEAVDQLSAVELRGFDREVGDFMVSQRFFILLTFLYDDALVIPDLQFVIF